MEELPIGTEVVLKVVETKDINCTGCFFDEIQASINVDSCNRIKCTSNERKDGKNVLFVREK